MDIASFSLIVGIYTTHPGVADGQINNNNDMVAVQYKRAIVGTMVNSYWQRSYIAAYDHKMHQNYGILLGAATGYNYECLGTREPVCDIDGGNFNDVLPVIAPYVTGYGFTATWQITALNISYRIGF